jgi:hypothetical protein
VSTVTCRRRPVARGCADGNSGCVDGMAAVGTLTGSRSVILFSFVFMFSIGAEYKQNFGFIVCIHTLGR